MANDRYDYSFIRSYIDENANTILVYKVYDLSAGLSCVVEGIHEHKVKRKGIKKLQKLLKEQEHNARNNK